MKRAITKFLYVILPLLFAGTLIFSQSSEVDAQLTYAITAGVGPHGNINSESAADIVSANYTASSRIYFTEFMTGQPGVFSVEANAESDDGLLKLTFPAGVKGQTAEGWALSYITLDQISAEEQSLPPPDGGNIIGLTYKLGPEGTTFDSPITITMHYDEKNFPQDIIDESSLIIGYWDTEDEQWVALGGCVLNAEKNFVTAPLNHFSTYAILGFPPAPASFSLSNMTVSPDEAAPGQEITISTVVTNTGGSSGKYPVQLKIDDILEDSREIILDAGANAPVEFKVNIDLAGKYKVDVNGNTGQFIITVPEGTIAGLPGTNVPSEAKEPVAVSTQETPSVEQTPVSEAETKASFPILWMLLGAAAVFFITLAVTLTIRRSNSP